MTHYIPTKNNDFYAPFFGSPKKLSGARGEVNCTQLMLPGAPERTFRETGYARITLFYKHLIRFACE
jgi:hypothetical protein